MIGGYWEGKLVCFNVETMSLAAVYCSHFGTVTALAVEESFEDFLVTGSCTGEIGRWKINEKDNSLKLIECKQFHSSPITSVSVNHELRVFGAADKEGRLLILNLFSGELIQEFQTKSCSSLGFLAILAGPLPVIAVFDEEKKALLSFGVNGQLISKRKCSFSSVCSYSVQKDANFNDILVLLFSF